MNHDFAWNCDLRVGRRLQQQQQQQQQRSSSSAAQQQQQRSSAAQQQQQQQRSRSSRSIAAMSLRHHLPPLAPLDVPAGMNEGALFAPFRGMSAPEPHLMCELLSHAASFAVTASVSTASASVAIDGQEPFDDRVRVP